MAVDLESRINSLLGGLRDLNQRLGAGEREGDDARYRAKSLVR